MPKDDEVLVRVARLDRYPRRRDGGAQRRLPLHARFHRDPPPEAHDLRLRVAGRSKRSARPRRSSTVGDDVFGFRNGANAEYVAVPESGLIAPKPAGTLLRGGGSGSRRLAARAELPAAAEPLEGRTSSSTAPQARSGRPRFSCSSPLRGASVTAVCDTKDVELSLARRPSGDRPLARRLHEERPDLRRDLRRGRQALFRRCRRSLKPGGTYITMDLGFMYHVPLALAWHAVRREQACEARHRPLPQGRPPARQELVDAGKYRPVIDRTYDARRDRRGDALRRERPEDGQRRPSRVLLGTFRGEQDRQTRPATPGFGDRCSAS